MMRVPISKTAWEIIRTLDLETLGASMLVESIARTATPSERTYARSRARALDWFWKSARPTVGSAPTSKFHSSKKVGPA